MEKKTSINEKKRYCNLYDKYRKNERKFNTRRQQKTKDAREIKIRKITNGLSKSFQL